MADAWPAWLGAAFLSRPISRPRCTLNADGAEQRRQRSFVCGGGKLISALVAGRKEAAGTQLGKAEFSLASYKVRSSQSVAARLLMWLIPPRGSTAPP